MRFGRLNLLVPVVVLVACVVALAQGPTYHLGRTASEEEIRASHIPVGPAGKELPPGSGTAKEGAKIYAQEKCPQCHGPTGSEGPVTYSNTRLVGGQGTLTTLRPVKTIGSYYAFATTIWDYIYRSMPPDEPGSLSADETYALTAYLLYRNDIIKESDIIDAKILPNIPMPNRNGFFPSEPVWKPGAHQPYFAGQPEPRRGGQTP